jgi:large subunit ribosomal protein L30
VADVALKQVRSANGTSRRQRDTLRSLGLGRIGRQSSHADSPQLRGMLRVVEHLVEVQDG